ncbi:MAG: thioesterase family protein [Candidatus Thermoplasmatota archaeon]
MPFTTEIPVRFRDIDGMGHVNNAVYFTFMEQVRSEWYRRTFGVRAVGEIDFILARAECDFKAPIGYGETVVVTAWVTRVGDSSFGFRYDLRSKATGTLFATGESVQVMYDYAAGKPKSIPPELRARLEAEAARP